MGVKSGINSAGDGMWLTLCPTPTLSPDGRHAADASTQTPTDVFPRQPLSIHGKRDADGRLASGGLLVIAYAWIGGYPTHAVVGRKLKRIDEQKRKTFQIVGRGG